MDERIICENTIFSPKGKIVGRVQLVEPLSIEGFSTGDFTVYVYVGTSAASLKDTIHERNLERAMAILNVEVSTFIRDMYE
jgi:hypothetical protein